MLELVPLEKIPTKQEIQTIIKELIKLDKISWTRHSRKIFEGCVDIEIHTTNISYYYHVGLMADDR